MIQRRRGPRKSHEQSASGIKRINFFKGFLTTEKDWNDAERYHIDKRRLHNRMLHSPGIVLGYGATFGSTRGPAVICRSRSSRATASTAWATT